MDLLDKLSRGYSSILVFDCEFWHVLNNGENVKNVNKSDFFFLPREIGGVLITKNKKWKLNNFFVTLDSPSKDMAFPASHFDTVGKTTKNKLLELEKQLELPWGESFYSELTPEGKKVFKDGVQLYTNDSNIKKHHKPLSWISKFMKVYSNSLVIVKGTSDIDALKNLCSIRKYTYLEPASLIDISNWNSESHKLCGSAKLEDTFHCIKPKVSSHIKELMHLLPLGEAHNPSSDAAMTLVVVLYILENKNTY